MAEKQSILIVEDDLDLAEMLNAYFRVQGYDVLTAAWGEDAVRISQENTPDIVLLDIRLPDMDGYEVCRRIRTQRRTENLPIIFLTERRDRIDKLQGLELGVVDYITKPFDIQELRLRVRNALRRASLESLVNPVTGLPEGKLVDEQLDKLVRAAGWTLLAISVQGIGSFREMYGFVAADDVLRAVSLMINNIVKEIGGEEDFVGHLSAEDFIVVTTEMRAREISERVNSRLTQSMDYFYPLKDRQAETNGRARLSLTLKTIGANSGPFADLGAIKSAVIRARSQ
ncbi:MAG: response regulator [Chloroflexota bacterium]